VIRSLSKLKFFIIITFTIVLLFTKAFVSQTDAAFKTAVNIPQSYVNIGQPSSIVTLPASAGGGYWYVDAVNVRVVRVNNAGEITREIGQLGSGEGEFPDTPRSITRDKWGYLYVLLKNCIVVKLEPNGGEVTRWGSCGSNYGQLSTPTNIAYDMKSNSLFIANSGTSRVVKQSIIDGNPLMEFGSYGTGDGYFQRIMEVATDSDGNIYVVDTDSHQVQVFYPNGQFAMKFGSVGTGNGQFIFPNGIGIMSINNNEKVVVASQNSQRIVVYNVDVDTLSASWDFTFGQAGSGNGKFSLAENVDIDSDDNIYVTDSLQKTIQKFDENGIFVSAFRNNAPVPGNLSFPQGLAYDSDGNLYISSNNEGIQKFSYNGNYLGTILSGIGGYFVSIDSRDRLFVSSGAKVLVYQLNDLNTLSVTLAFEIGSTQGSAPGQLNDARGIGFDSNEYIYVADSGNNRIQKFDPDNGQYLDSWGQQGSGNGQFQSLDGLVVDSQDNIYVADVQNGRVQKFNTLKQHLQSISGFAWPRGLAVDGSDNLYVTSMHGHVIKEFNSIGTQIAVFGSMGSGNNHFIEPTDIDISPTDGRIAVSDALNHRAQIYAIGVGIENLNPSSDVYRQPDRLSLTKSFIDPGTPGIDNIDSKLFFGEYATSKFSVDITDSPDWNAVEVTNRPDSSKSLLVNVNTVDAPGISSTHSLYVVKTSDQHSVYVCPNATKLSQIQVGCTGGYQLEEGVAVNLFTEVIYGITYWRIDGLTGTGALGLSISTPLSRLVLTPDTSPTGNTQEVTITYTPPSGFIASDRIQISFEDGAGFTLNNSCAVPTTNADGIGGNDGSASIIGGDIYEYTFTDDVDIGLLTFCASVTAPLTAGSYSVRLTDDNGTFDATLYYVGGDSNVTVTANVALSLSFNIRGLDDTELDPLVCSFGTISPSTPVPNYNNVDDGVGECGYSLAVGSNSPGGFGIQVRADGPLNAGYTNIASVANGGTFSPGVEAYGIANVTVGNTGRNPATADYTESFIREGNFNLAPNTATGIPTSDTLIVSYSNSVEYMAGVDSSDVTQVVHGLVVGSGTPAGYYDQVLTYTTTANF
jgi:sugar lactone lactonase YvrE